MPKMKNLTQLKRQLAMRPFRPFWLETSGGKRIRVSRPDWFIEVPERWGTFIVFGEGFVSHAHYGDLTDLIEVEDPRSEEQSGKKEEPPPE
jgi:hypothetical protein